MMTVVPATFNVNIDIGTAIDIGIAIDTTGAGTAHVIGARVALAVTALHALLSAASAAPHVLLSAAASATAAARATASTAWCPCHLSHGKQNEAGDEKCYQLCHK
jgi:hypothetical protein